MDIDDGRYVRNLALEGFSIETQIRISESRVAIVGAGALGSVVAMYLAAAGVGCLRIADYDTVSLGNLQRQVFFRESEAGLPKCEVLSERVRSLNGTCHVECFREAVTAENLQGFVTGCDVLAVCTDSHSSKTMTVEGAGGNMPVVVGGVREYQGQVAVFMGDSDMGYGDIFPADDSAAQSSPGVFSPVPGIVGSIQASEVLKLLTGIGEPLFNTLLHFDVRDMEVRRFRF